MSEKSEQELMEEYRRDVEERVEAEAEDLKEDPVAGDDEIDLALVERCFWNNEVGDSLLYNLLHRKKHLYQVISKQWLTYIGPHWEIDYDGRALSDVENVAKQYERMHARNEADIEKFHGDKDKTSVRNSLKADQKLIVKRLNTLRSHSGRVAVLKCCISNSDPLTIHPDQLDQHPWLLPLKNCVVDLRTGKDRPGRPEDYLSYVAPVNWEGIDAKAPTWDRMLNTSLAQNQEVIDFLHRVLGYSITGLNKERVFVVLYGKNGQNGKGKLMEILFHILGKLSGPIQTEMLMAQRFAKSADGPTPAVMSLKGRRFAWASETEEGGSFAAGKLKLYSGGDPLVGRKPNDKDDTVFIPTHTLWLLCNVLPGAPAHDSAFWERIKVIDFPYTFVQRKPTVGENGQEIPPVLAEHERLADPDMFDKLVAEASGIIAALVRGCLSYQKQGLNPPKKVIDDSLKYRRKEDDIQDFIDQCCDVDPDYKTPAKELYSRYKVWWEEVSPNRPISMKKFGDLMGRKFKKIKSSSVVYLGVKIDLMKLNSSGLNEEDNNA